MEPYATMLLSSGDLIADRRFEWARDREAKGDLAAAADLLLQALERVPGYASAWFSLGELRERLGDREGAARAFGKARETDPEDRHGAALQVARLTGGRPAPMPQAYVRTLFDHYAPAFDSALSALSYRAPAILLEAVRARAPSANFANALDLGCGTGLGGTVFRPLAQRLVGVDLSPGMVAQARAKNLYDRLEAADILDFLRGEANAQYQLVVAADVFMYFDDLAPVVAAVAPVLAPDALFAFTVESHAGDDVVLRETLRFAHGKEHVRHALAAASLKALSLEAASSRTEKKAAVPGLVVVAAKP